MAQAEGRTIDARGILMRLLALRDRLTPAPTEPLSDEDARRRRTVLAFLWIGALPWTLIFSFVYEFVLNCRSGALFCAAAFLLMLPIPRVTRSAAGVHLAAHWLIAVVVSTLVALGAVTGGAGAPALAWLVAIPLVAIHIAGFRPGIAWCGVALAFQLGFEALHSYSIAVPQYLSREEFEDLAVMGNAGLMLLITTLAGAYDSQRFAALRLAGERQESLRVALARAEGQAREIERGSAALRESEMLYRSLVRNSPKGMHFYDLNREGDLILVESNPAADQLTGVDSGTLLGLRIEDAFPNSAATEAPARFRAAAEEGIPWSVEQFPYRNGAVARVFELRAFQTTPRRMAAIFMDVSDRLHAEAVVRASEREIALQAGKAEVATHVLHNIGNVLSSVKVSATHLRELVKQSETPTVGLVAGLLAENQDRIAAFIQQDERGRALPEFLQGLAEVLAAEQASLVAELKCMSDAIEHIALVIGMQQVHSRGGALLETVRPADIVEQALSISISGRQCTVIEIVRDFEDLGSITLQRHRVIQILVNLFNNAAHAVTGAAQPRITCRVAAGGPVTAGVVRFSVTDNGVGIAAAQLSKIFTFGFTTRPDGHGFGLHSCANLAQEMGGELRVSSDGEGRGATFVLDVPLVPKKVGT